MSNNGCQHADGYLAYPGELTRDPQGNQREDGVRLVCGDCGEVRDEPAPGLKACAGCAAPLATLDEFPGGLCLPCYADSPAGRRMPTASEVAVMWGGSA